MFYNYRRLVYVIIGSEHIKQSSLCISESIKMPKVVKLHLENVGIYIVLYRLSSSIKAFKLNDSKVFYAIIFLYFPYPSQIISNIANKTGQ